jgi:hypothetical protein
VGKWKPEKPPEALLPIHLPGAGHGKCGLKDVFFFNGLKNIYIGTLVSIGNYW